MVGSAEEGAGGRGSQVLGQEGGPAGEGPCVLGEESGLSQSCSSPRKLPVSLTPCGHILMPSSLVAKLAEEVLCGGPPGRWHS